MYYWKALEEVLYYEIDQNQDDMSHAVNNIKDSL